MKFIATKIVTHQVNNNKCETTREVQVFDENNTFADLKKWINRKDTPFAIQINCLND